MGFWNSLGNIVESFDPFTGFGAATGMGYTGGSVTRSLGWDPTGQNQVAPTGTASQMEANIEAAQMANWETQYKPLELQQLQQSSLNNPDILPDAVNKAEATATAASSTAASEGQRVLSSRGITATPGQQTAMNRMNNLNTAATTAGAANRARQTVATNDELIALGSAPSPNVAGKSLQ
jgi:hypothetical protein